MAYRTEGVGRSIARVIPGERAFTLALVSALGAFAFKETVLPHLANWWVLGIGFAWLFGVILSSAFSVVGHAEALAEHYGEPYGTLILTLSAVSIEVIMIVSMMLHGDPDPTMARDTIYATLMIIINGLIGLAQLLGGLRHGEQRYNLKSSNAFFSMILALLGLGLFVPNFVPHRSRAGYGLFLACASVLLYLVFLRTQTTEHRHFFTQQDSGAAHTERGPVHPHGGSGLFHAGLLVATIALIAYLAEFLAILIDEGIEILGLPDQVASLVVALLVLSPEGVAATRAGLHNDMQRVVNIALGSALSTISLTIPAVLVVGQITGREVILGVTPIQATMLAFTILIGMNSYRIGETNVLHGLIHFALFAAYVALIFF